MKRARDDDLPDTGADTEAVAEDVKELDIDALPQPPPDVSFKYAALDANGRVAPADEFRARISCRVPYLRYWDKSQLLWIIARLVRKYPVYGEDILLHLKALNLRLLKNATPDLNLVPLASRNWYRWSDWSDIKWRHQNDVFEWLQEKSNADANFLKRLQGMAMHLQKKLHEERDLLRGAKQ